ncbi:MAG: zinc ribbon domain-containing protein [Chloroflexi bacterium]|nr:zinc ribbon domain-containing protein [Chloroflexota bacterium]
MAIYEYLCPKCQREFELRRPIGEADRPAKCPKCGSRALKLISGFASKTGDSIQPPGQPFRNAAAVAASSGTGRGKAARPVARRRSKARTRK